MRNVEIKKTLLVPHFSFLIIIMVTKTAAEIIAIANSTSRNNNNRAGFDYEDIDTTDMPELTAEQLANMEPARIFERLPEQLRTQIACTRHAHT